MLKHGACEELCDRPGCFANRGVAYSPKGVHTYVLHCAWGTPMTALHLMLDGRLLVAERDRTPQHVFTYRLTWSDAVTLEPVSADQALVRATFPRSRWLEQPGWVALGPYPLAEARGLAGALHELTTPTQALPVSEAELIAHPRAYHGKLIATEGTWRTQFESCSFAKAWSTLPQPGYGEWRARAIGLWLSDPRHVYGHMGMYASQLIVVEATAS